MKGSDILNKQILEAAGCCEDLDQYIDIKPEWTVEELFDHCLENEEYDDLRYGLSYLMTEKQRVEWVVFCAESCLHVFEAEHPDDDRPRKAIELSKKSLTEDVSKEDLQAAANDAYAARTAAYAARTAAHAAADAARTAAEDAGAGIESLLRKGYEILTNDETGDD